VKNILLQFSQPRCIIAHDCWRPVPPARKKQLGVKNFLLRFVESFPPKRRREFTRENQQGAKTIQQPFATLPLDPDLDSQCKKIE
jgi:hypothetical protein